MAKHQHYVALIEQLIEEMTSVLMKWNTSSLTGQMIITFGDTAIPGIKYMPYVYNQSACSDPPVETTKSTIHQNSMEKSKEIPFQRCHNTSESSVCTLPCQQNDLTTLAPKSCSLDNFVNEKSILALDIIKPIIESTPLSFRKDHNLLIYDQDHAVSPTLVPFHSDLNSAPSTKIVLPPFEKLMQAKNNHSVQNMLTDSGTKYEHSSGIQTLPQTCYNSIQLIHDIPSQFLSENTNDQEEEEGETAVNSHATIAVDVNSYKQEINSALPFLNSSVSMKNTVADEVKDLNPKLPSGYSSKEYQKSENVTLVNKTDRASTKNAFEGQSNFNENRSDITIVSKFMDGHFDEIDLLKLDRSDLIKIVTHILQRQSTKQAHSSYENTIRNLSYPQKLSNVPGNNHRGKDSSGENLLPKLCSSRFPAKENNSFNLTQAIEKRVTNLRINNENGDNLKYGFQGTPTSFPYKDVEKSTSKSKNDQMLNQSLSDQNVKPLKKRTRLCTSFRNDDDQGPQGTIKHGLESNIKNPEQPYPNYHIINEGTNQRRESKMTDAKTMKKTSFICKICMNSFSSRNTYRQHLRSHDGCFRCNVCGKVMKTKDSLYHHQRGLHSKEKPYHCKECGMSFNFYHSYKLHLQRHKGERPHKCKYCEKSYLTFNHLKEHVQAIHSNTYIVCHICGKTFSYNSTLKLHLYRHTGDLPHKCSTCSKTFLTKQALKIHVASHTKDKNFQCETCGKCFKSEYSRNRHTKKHKKLHKRFMCDVCGKTFLYKCILESHVQIHSKLRPHMCNICEKGFKSKPSLYSHKYNVHKEGLKFPCSLCDKSFKTKSCLTAHVKRHQNEDIHTCGTCGGTFPDKGGLNKHMKTVHLRHKCFICKICGKTGTRADNMRTHVKKHKTEISLSSNPMDFIREELGLDSSANLQNFVLNERQRRGEKNQNSHRFYSGIISADQHRPIQPCPILYKNAIKSEFVTPVAVSSTSILPSLSQGTSTRHYNDIHVNDTPKNISRTSKEFNTYLSNDQDKSAHFLSYFCQPDVTDSNTTNNITFSNGPLTTLMSSINGQANQESDTSLPYSYVIAPPQCNYQMNTRNFHSTEAMIPRSVECFSMPDYGIGHEKTITTLQNVTLGIAGTIENVQVSDSLNTDPQRL